MPEERSEIARKAKARWAKKHQQEEEPS
jgi:hypothetical protein